MFRILISFFWFIWAIVIIMRERPLPDYDRICYIFPIMVFFMILDGIAAIIRYIGYDDLVGGILYWYEYLTCFLLVVTPSIVVLLMLCFM